MRSRFLTMLCLFAGMAAAWSGVSPGSAAPYPVSMETRLRLQVRPLAIQAGETTTFKPRTVVLSPTEGAELLLKMEPAGGDVARVSLRFQGVPSESGPIHSVHLESEVHFPGRRPVEEKRDLRLEEHAVRLVEVYARGATHLTLALNLDTVLVPVVQQPTGLDRPVEFLLRVSRISGDTSTVLETNTLKTFLGKPVSYSFRRGEGASLETLHLELTPSTIQGDLLEIRISLSGQVRTGATPLFLNRSQSMVTGRGSSSDFQATAGDPPDGYSFTVTPRF